MAEQPIEISISPYGPEPDERVRRPVSHLLLGAGWLGAAALAVAASFTKVYGISFTDTGADPPEAWHFSMDGWGRTRVSPSVLGGFSAGDLGAGPRYGVLLCLAAAAMVLGWLIQRSRQQPWASRGPLISGQACIFLGGVVACQLVATWPKTVAPDDAFGFGPSLFLGAGSVLLGLATWIVDWRGRKAGVPLPQDAG